MVEVGDTVWVRMGNKNEEPCTVLELNVSPVRCNQLGDVLDEEIGRESKNGMKSSGYIEKSSSSMHILVRAFHGLESVITLDDCRVLGRGSDNSQNHLRRSTRARRDHYGCLIGMKTAHKDINGEVKAVSNDCLVPVDVQVPRESKDTERNSGSEDGGDDNMTLDEIKEKHIRKDSKVRKRKFATNHTSKIRLEQNEICREAAKKCKQSDSPSLKKNEMNEPSSPYFENEKSKKSSKKPPRKVQLTKETKTKRKTSAVTKKGGIAKKNNIEIIGPGQPDGNGGLDQGATYMIEYAKTARSTCKRCDIRIEKNMVRVGHRPLFRGKPGFRIFKHLHCIVFSEDVKCAEDIAGHEYLEKDDYNALVKRVEESFQEIKAENEELEPDELVQKKFEGEIRPLPKGLIANLLPFQREGVSWMYDQENNTHDGVRGGILADEMGMGKTLQTITAILDNRPRLQRSIPGGKYPPCAPEERKSIDFEEGLWKNSSIEWEHEMKMNDVHETLLSQGLKKGEPEGGARAGTLVVCPLIALSQWKTEIEKFCEAQALSVCIYHGPDRVKIIPRNLLTKYDIVLTTYQVLEADFRKMVSPNKVKCPNCGGKFKVDKLRIHLKYFCGEGAQRTEAQSRTIRNSERRNTDQRRVGRDHRTETRDNKEEEISKKIAFKNRKKTLVVKSIEGFASESDLSTKEEEVTTLKRGKSSRGAAIKARSRLKSIQVSPSAQLGGNESDDSFSLDLDSDSESNDDDQKFLSSVYSKATKDNHSMKRAIKRQAQAMKGIKSKEKKKKFPHENSDKKKTAKKRTQKVQKAKHDNGKSESSDDNDSGLEDNDIDMDALVEEAMAGATMSHLHSVCWWRIVLDEAHMIKSRSSQTSHAAFALTGIHRWALSGTPLQNRVGEFYSLIRFLRLDPMAYYMCRAKGCDCKQIHYRMSHGKCRCCGHGSVQHYSHFNRHILNPIQRDGYSHDGRRAMFVLKDEVLDKCLIRRTKETRAEEMNLPPRVVTIKAVRLHPVEEDFYNALYTQTTSTFNDYVDGGTLLNNYAHIFDLLMRMRQSVAHPYLVLYSGKDLAISSNSAVTNGRIDCHLCSEPPTERVVSSCCQTAFCKSCVLDYMELSAGANNAGTQCPQCNQPFTIDLNHVQDNMMDQSSLKVGNEETISSFGLPSLKELPHVASGSILRKIDLTKFATSTKIEALTKELVEMRQKSPGSKAIVFSQFVNMLDLIRWRLHSDPFLSNIGLGATALHGGMDIKSRDTVLQNFREDPNVRVLLMSLKAGGVALNLTVANHVYLMDPWWNPAAELQAIDRTHRLGQYRPIRAVRFIAENTVEERILQLQEKKRLVFDGTVGRDAGSLKMLTVDDMKSLFA